MTQEPDFRELVGDEGDREELDRLHRVHELLVAAGPPAELSPHLTSAPDVEESKVLEFKRRRPATLLALGIAAAVAAFIIGYSVGARHNSFSAQGPPIPMHGIGQMAAARADIKVGSHDSGGNYPLQMTVQGLPRLSKGGWYELLLSKHGQPTLSCGSFALDGGRVSIRLSVPYDLNEFGKLFDGWVVVEHAAGQRVAPIVMST